MTRGDRVSDVLEFPSEEARSLAAAEEIFRRELVGRGAPEEAIEEIVGRMKRVLQVYDVDPQTEVSPPTPDCASEEEEKQLVAAVREAIEDVRDQVTDHFTNTVLPERFEVEVELYRARNPGSF